MSWLAHVRNLAEVAPVPHGLAWRPLAALVATAGVFFVWSAFDSQLPAEPAAPATFARPLREARPPEKVSVPVQAMTYTAGRGVTAPDEATDNQPLAAAPELLPRERHERPDYVVESPDVLSIVVRSDEADEETCQALSGSRLVEPDGSINLSDVLGTIEVGGLSLAEIPSQIRQRLEQNGLDAQVSVSVAQQNSKVYYIVSTGAEDECGTVMRNPASGKETVRDALDHLPDVDWAQKTVWIARAASGDAEQKVLAVRALDVASGGNDATNYTLEPGDRVFIADQVDVWQRLGEVLSATWEAVTEILR